MGETIDIHGGGVDLVFPHHENEVAQSTCAHGGARYARYWLHNGLVQADGEKMSKSLGNVRLVRDLLAEHGGETVRLALLTAHYRQPLDWTDQLVVESRQKLDRMYGALRDAGISGPLTRAPAAAPPPTMLAALEDELNTPEAIAELFGVVRATNRATDAAEKRALAESLRAGAWLLGLLTEDPQTWFAAGGLGGGDDAEIDTLVKQRDALRQQTQLRGGRSHSSTSSRNAGSSSRTQPEAPVGGGLVEPVRRRPSALARPDPPLSAHVIALAWAPVPLPAHLLELCRGGSRTIRGLPRRVAGGEAPRPLPPVGPVGVRSGTGRRRAAGREAVALDRKLLDIVCCPVTRSSLELLPERELAALNELIGARRIKNREDAVVDAPLAEALVTRSGKLIYPVRDGIPLLLEDQAMPLQQLEGA